ncbi:MAG TPA: DUF3857 domain-containing protein [Puia sp.]|jgi:hypothetical protein|nr:DUF3857 domain-containing protein [Puia sp.]
MKKILIPLLFPFTTVMAQTTQPAQPAITLEQWDPKPVMHSVDAKYSGESAVILLDERRMEYVDEAKNDMSLYRTLHRIVRVNDDQGIEAFNKIYLGVSDNSDIVDIKARTILPGGKIIEVDRKNIKDLKEEDGNMYKIFAMEGLEKGCEVEYYYTFKRPATFFGHEQIQAGFPVLDAHLEVITPERLRFEMKGYNCEIAVRDTVLNGKRIAATKLRDVHGVEKEKYAAYEANLERIEYKLSYNSAVSDGKVRLFTWNELAKRVYTNDANFSEGETKKAAELIRHNGWDKLNGETEKIVAVENYVKKKFATRNDITDDNAENVEWILKNSIASSRGILRLYVALFKGLGVELQVVLTCDRSEAVIDRGFENWQNTSEFLLYFPAEKKFLAPTELGARYPWFDPYWGAHDALFCKATTIGTFTTAIAEIKPVPLEDYTESFSKIDATLQLNPGMDTLLVDMQQRYAGYAAFGYREGFTLGNAEEQHAFLKELVKFGTNSENIVSSKIENADFESLGQNKPFTLQANVKASELLENAGNKVLVKIGEIIGPQTEMYQEKPRQFPIMIDFPHTLERNIELVIPDGYTIKNPDELTIHGDYTENGQVTMGFSSEYKLEGNRLKVHVVEQYRRVNYPLAEYEDFKKVINASADFNKIVLVLEKNK